MRFEDFVRVRRHHPTRLEGFFDAAFAFAVTLVVISIGHVPHSVPELLQALRGIPLFALCFLTLASIWREHHRWSRLYDLEDARSITLSFIIVFLVLVYAYPLRMLFALALHAIAGDAFIDEPVELHSYGELRIAFVVYGLGYAAIWSAFALLYRHALRESASIGLDVVEQEVTRFWIAIKASFVVVALCSVVLALALPFETHPWTSWLPGMTYAAMSLIAPVLKKRWQPRVETLVNTA